LRLLVAAGHLGDAFHHDHFGLSVKARVDAVHALVQEENAAVGGLDLDALFTVQVIDLQVDASFLQAHGQVRVAQRRHLFQCDHRVGVQAQVVQAAQVYGQAAVGGAHDVLLEQRQVDRGFFRALVVGAPDETLALHALDAHDLGVVVIFGFVGIRFHVVGPAGAR